jgi:hypothetical protein
LETHEIAEKRNKNIRRLVAEHAVLVVANDFLALEQCGLFLTLTLLCEHRRLLCQRSGLAPTHSVRLFENERT